jgi:hypothetical protein
MRLARRGIPLTPSNFYSGPFITRWCATCQALDRPLLVHNAIEIYFSRFWKTKNKNPQKFVWSSLVILSILRVTEARAEGTKRAETASCIDNWVWSLALWNGVRAFELQADRGFAEEMVIGGLISNRNFSTSFIGSGTGLVQVSFLFFFFYR